MSNKILAVIPARAGSKGLPNKNIRPLCGLPLLAHSIMCAKLVPEITRTIVSTDGAEIAAVSRAYGADVPFMRPAELADDASPMMPVVQHALRTAEEMDGLEYDSVLLLDPTSPARLPADISSAVELLLANSSAQGVVACSRPEFNPFWVGVVERDGFMAPAFPQGRFVRRQDVPPFFRINGALYLWRRDFVRGCEGPWWPNERLLMLEIPESRAFAIDSLFEFTRAELSIQSGLIILPWLEAGARP